jgi:hypothetical protein
MAAMNMDAFLWMALPIFVAAGSAFLTMYIMQARMDVAIARERELLAQARAMLDTQKIAIDERVRATEEAVRRKALDEFMQEFRVEERSYMRESKTMFAARKLMVMQERLYFRNIPLSNWVEHEMVVEEGSDPQQLATSRSVFGQRSLGADTRTTLSRLLEDAAPAMAARSGLM